MQINFKMNPNHYCIIMAGGIGSRFWPLSRTEKPKQFVDILGTGKTFIQMTYERFAPFIPKENFMVVTGKAYKGLVLEQLPWLNEDQVLLEPERRNTAPCIAYAACKLKKKNRDAVMVVTPADHLVLNTEVFEEVISQSLDFASRNNCLTTIGITPSFPSTGYGYIEMSDERGMFKRVASFKEKPDYETACTFIDSGRFVWNSGIFVWSVASFITALEKHLPDIAEAFEAISDDYFAESEQRAVDKTYSECRSISVDYGIMEKADNVYVTKADFGWSDLGTWASLYEYSNKDSHGNVRAGEQVELSNTGNSLIKETNPQKRVVIDGVENLLVVDTEDVLFICPRNDENHVKKVIEAAIK